MPGVNPLERGKNLDILLKTLMEAGITSPSLAFLLGVNPETLSAYLLRASPKGALRTIPAPDWYENQQSKITLLDNQLINLGVTTTLTSFTVYGPQLYYVTASLDDYGSGDSAPRLRFTSRPISIFTAVYTEIQLAFSSTTTAILMFPTGVIVPTIIGVAGWASLNVTITLEAIPVGAI